MMSRIRTFLPIAVVAGIAIVGSAPSAKATLEISISAGAFTTTITDQVAPGDTNTAAGLLQAEINSINSGLAAAGVGLSFADLGAASSLPNNQPGAVLSINGDVTATGTGTVNSITIDATDTSYPLTNPHTLVSTASDSFTNATGTRTFESWFNPTNGEFDKGVPAPLITHTLSGTSSLSDTTMGITPPTSPFGLTNETVITLTAGTLGFSGKTTVLGAVVPEPSTVVSAMVGAPLLALGLWRRQRRSRA